MAAVVVAQARHPCASALDRHGVVSVVSTDDHHQGMVRGTPRPERNMFRAVSGDPGRLEATPSAILTKVLA